MAKQNKWMMQHEAALEAKWQEICRRRVNTAYQLAGDAAVIAANDVLGLGRGRAKAFCDRMCEVMVEICRMSTEDYADDKEFVYTKEKVDERLREIMGDHFQPWEIRYE